MTLAQFCKNHLSLVAAAVILIIVAVIGWKYIASVIIAGSLAIVAMPFYRKMCRKLPAPFSAGIVSILVSIIIVGIGAFTVTVIFLGKDTLSMMLQQIIVFIGKIFNFEVSAGTGTEFIESLLSLFSGSMADIALGILSSGVYIVLACIFFFVSLYLFFIFGDKLAADVWSVIPEQSKPNSALMRQKTKDILFALYIVQVVVAFLTAILAIPYLLLMGYGNIVLFATLCGFLALIPLLGAPLVLIFLGLYALALGDIHGIIITVTVGVILLWLLPDFFIRPKLTGKRVQIRPMLVFVGFFGGAAILGLIGFVIGPVLLVLCMAAYEIFFKELRTIKEEIEDEPAPMIPDSDEVKR